MTFRIIYH